MPAYSGYKDYQDNQRSIYPADVGEKLVALGSGAAEGAVDLATLPVRLGSVAADTMGLITPRESLDNIELLDNASYAAGNYMDEGQAMRNNPNTRSLGNALVPVPAAFAVAKHGYKMRPPINKNTVVNNSNRTMRGTNVHQQRRMIENEINNASLAGAPQRQVKLGHMQDEAAEAAEQAKLQSMRYDDGMVVDPWDINRGAYDDAEALNRKLYDKSARKYFGDGRYPF